MKLFPASQSVPVTEIPAPGKIRLFLKREDLIHPKISGNKYWKLYYNVQHYLETNPENPVLITYGGAFSNHIAASAALGNLLKIKTVGIIRGEELLHKISENPTLQFAVDEGMTLHFVTREEYREKNMHANSLKEKFPGALIIPEGGSNKLAVEGVRFMLNGETKDFDYLCSAVGTGGTLAGLSKYCEDNQKVIGFTVVNDTFLKTKIEELSGSKNFELADAGFGGYGKISDRLVGFINSFRKAHGIQLDPIYTGKMMMRIFELAEEGFFAEGSKILAFHTGGLQGIKGANSLLKKQNRDTIDTFE